MNICEYFSIGIALFILSNLSTKKKWNSFVKTFHDAEDFFMKIGAFKRRANSKELLIWMYVDAFLSVATWPLLIANNMAKFTLHLVRKGK